MSEWSKEGILELLGLLASSDDQGALWWRTDDKYAPVTFFINCNDEFYWATADGEDVTPETLPELRQAIEDAQVAEEEKWPYCGTMLYCARRRKMRPQKPAYPKLNGFRYRGGKEVPPEDQQRRLEAITALLDACGPERTPWDQDGLTEAAWRALTKREKADDPPEDR